ncbi:MAG: anti-sigma factor [Acidimicrobiales bacterium]
MSDACREWRGDLAAMAINRLQPDERARVLAHTDGCANCRSELTMFEHLGRAMAHADATRLDHEPAPPPELRDRIMMRLSDERAVVRRLARRRIGVAVAAVAAVVLVAFGATVILHDSGSDDRVPFSFALADTNGSFALHRNSTGTSIDFTQEGLDPNAIYWLWLTDASGKRVAAGTFNGTTTPTTVTMQAALPLELVVRVWVTDKADVVVLDKTL